MTGCEEINPDCNHCAAAMVTLRLQTDREVPYVNGFDLARFQTSLAQLLAWRQSCNIFSHAIQKGD